MKSSDIFNCKKCGNCCKGYGGTFITAKEIEIIADYINSDPTSFTADKCQMSGDRPVLAQSQNGYCIFWDGLCTIHPVKPKMCRAWPFIESIIIDTTNWHIMAESCPGMRVDISDRAIKECVGKELAKKL